MNTISQWISALPEIPMGSVWLLNDLSEYRGKQELFTRQSPQKLKALREHALIESAVSSNRIEGVEVDQKRIGTVLFGKGHLQDRDEEEVRGYQQALSWIHSGGFPYHGTSKKMSRSQHRSDSQGSWPHEKRRRDHLQGKGKAGALELIR